MTPMKIEWSCRTCGAKGYSFNRDGAAAEQDGRWAAALHHAVSPDCAGDITAALSRTQAARKDRKA